MEPAERAAVRVFRGGDAVGMGFLVGADLVLTCAHVVGDEVDFPFLGPASAVSEVFRSDSADVAVLRVAEVPAGARALRVVAHDGLRDHRVRAFGVTAHRPDGVWSHGVVRSPIAGGRIHVEDDRSHGVPLSRGFSGGPLLDDELGAVVGMVVEVEERADRRIGYALSGAALHETWPDLASLAAADSPFRGLEPFAPEDAEHFFGRAARARELRDLLDGTGVLVVAGPSGSGKSSLVMAGLLPLLDGDSVIVRPAVTSTPWAATESVLRLITDPRFSTLSDRTTTAGTPDLREVIEGPLRPVGMPVLQEGLADALLADLSGESNPLPLLEFTLTLLWERQHRGVLTHQAYRDLGGVAGAVSTYAEQVWQRFDPTEIRHALTQLVSPLPGGGHVRRAVPIEDVGEISAALARTRLVTLGPSTVELAHHALVDHWQRLHDWVEESRDFRTWQDTPDRTAHHWTTTHDRALLPRGKPLRRARTLARTQPLTRTQRHFLTAATKARTRRTTVRTLAAAVVALLVLSLVLAVRIADDEQTRFAVDAAAGALLDRAAVANPDRRILTTLRAHRTADRADTRAALRLLANEHQYTEVIAQSTAITSNPSGTRLFDTKRAEFWDLTTDPPRRTRGPAQRWTWAGDDSLLGTAADGLKRWDVVTGGSTTLNDDFADTAVSDGSGRWIAAVGAVSGAKVAEVGGIECAYGLFSADARAVAAVSAVGDGAVVRLRMTGDAESERVITVPPKGEVRNVGVEPSGDYRVVMTTTEGITTLRVPPPDDLDRAVRAGGSVAFAPDRAHAVLQVEGDAEVWHLDRRVRVGRTERFGEVAAVDAAGELIALQKLDRVEVWDLRRGQPVADLDLPDFTVVVDARFRADSDQLELDLQAMAPPVPRSARSRSTCGSAMRPGRHSPCSAPTPSGSPCWTGQRRVGTSPSSPGNWKRATPRSGWRSCAVWWCAAGGSWRTRPCPRRRSGDRCVERRGVAEYIAIRTDDGSFVPFEVEEEYDGPVRAGRKLDEALGVVDQTLEAGVDNARRLARAVARKIGNMPDFRPDKVMVEVGLKVTAEAGVVIAKSGVEAHVKITAEWQRANLPSTPAEDDGDRDDPADDAGSAG
ncbi:CU044_2847 family protein [Actinosynnema sp. CA-248983]